MMVEVADSMVVSAGGGRVVINPTGTNYQLELAGDGVGAGEVVAGVVKLKGRKVWTISAGGGFISPVVGEPRLVQGRVMKVEGKRMWVQAGTRVCVELPEEPTAFDLKQGPVTPGVMVNVTAFPGAAFEVAR